MSKIIDNHLLERIGNPKKLIEQSLENQIRQVEAGLDEDSTDLISKILLLFIPKEGRSLQLDKSEIEEKLHVDQSVSKTNVQNILQRLSEAGILKAENEQYEIASAVLANHIYERIESDNRVLRKVETFIHERFNTFQENKNLLNQDDLNYINPYLSSVSISKEEAAFIEKSKTKISRRRRYILLAVIFIVSALAALAFSAFLQSQEAQRQRDIAKNASLELKYANDELEIARQKEIDKNQLLAANNQELDIAKNKAEEESEANRKLAAENKKLADVAQEEAAKNIAANEKLAEAARRDAEFKTELAKKNKELAKAAQAEADRNAQLASKNKELGDVRLSRNIAKQATQLDEKETELKALLAKEAYNINTDSKEYGDINHPDIYSALYVGLKSLNKLENNEDFNKISNERGAIRSIVFDESGDVFYTVGSYGALKKWEVKKWNAIDKPEVIQTTIDQLPCVQNVLKISPDNQWLVVGGEGKNINLYNLKYGKSGAIQLNLHDGQEVEDIVFVPDNSGFISRGADKTLQFYNIKDKKIQKIANLPSQVEAMCITTKKPYLLYYGTVQGKLFEQPINGLPLQLEPNEHNEAYQKITAIAVHEYDDVKILAIGYVNGLVKFFQADFSRFQVNRGGNLLFFPSKLHSARITSLTFNKTKQQLCVASYDGTASLWDLKETDLRHYQPILFDDYGSWIMSMAFSEKSDQILLGNRDGEILFFNPDPSIYAEEICNKLNRNLNRDEWAQFIGEAIKFRKTCP